MSKLKAKDLMIGDYLLWNGSPYRVTQVNSIDGGMSNCNFILENGVEDEGEPIPLTPEILEKIGFEKRANYFVYDEDDGNSYIVLYPKETNYTEGSYTYVDIDWGCVSIRELPLESLHELQHVLRLCGIKKEIKL